MKPTRFQLLALSILLVVGLALWFGLRSGSDPVKSQGSQPLGSSAKPSKPLATIREGPAGGNRPKRPSTTQISQDQKALKADILRRWNESSSLYKGEALVEYQRSLVLEAADLGASAELLEFAKFLKDKGANDFWLLLLKEAGDRIFSGPDAVSAREWLVKVTDMKVRERLCFEAGRLYNGGDVKGFVKSFAPDPQGQSAVLSSFAANLAKTDPEGATKLFFELRPGNVDFSGLTSVMAALPASADFAKISSFIGEDSKGYLAARARGALLKSWAATQPEDAAQYVISNSGTASPEQMGTVVETWAKQAPDKAAAWIHDLSPGKVRDEGNAGLVKYWLPTDPSAAWEFALDVGDAKKRNEVALKVYGEWQKTDPPAAFNAWKAAFAGAQ